MIDFRDELSNEGVLSLDGFRWSDGFAWCELRPLDQGDPAGVNIRYLWASDCRKGYGTALLAKIIRAADRLGRKLYLEVEPFDKQADGRGLCFDRPRPGGMDRDQLVAWYAKHGFTPLRGKLMVRQTLN